MAPFKNTRSASVARKQIRFNARSFVAFALAPEAPLSDWFDGLDQWTENSPGFFAGRPVVLNLNHITLDTEEIIDLVDGLADRGIRVCAIEANGIEDLGLDLPPLLTGARTIAVEDREPERRQAETANTPANAPANTNEQAAPVRAVEAKTLIIDTPIRSGQSIFHPPFAGVLGNPDARIFCRKNEAELLAVDGWYRTADDMEPSSRGRAIQAHLDNEVIWVSALD
ncbi:MAG: septum formation inhibitor MinC [Rhizobiales bacterium]|nr:septum formation inhibitor MinC [Hyphomicrobiales bacterium]